jgi:hypothetical protein
MQCPLLHPRAVGSVHLLLHACLLSHEPLGVRLFAVPTSTTVNCYSLAILQTSPLCCHPYTTVSRHLYCVCCRCRAAVPDHPPMNVLV